MYLDAFRRCFLEAKEQNVTVSVTNAVSSDGCIT